MEPVENVWQIVLGDTHAFVAHDELGGFSGFLERDTHRPAFRAVFDGVGEKIREDTMCAVLVNRYDDTRRLGLEHKMVEVGHELLFEHSLPRERDQLSPGQQQCQWVTRMLE